jgi:GTP-binding protein EngB required for normal cell division
LQQRKGAGRIHVSFFGEISSGKSSLIKALLPGSVLETSAVGGTTREIAAYSWHSPSGDELILTDMPGTNEVGQGLDDLARAEALRSHLVVYVCDGDLSRTQYQELQALLELGKPLIVALNKTDRYRREELDLLRDRLAERLAEGVTARPAEGVTAGLTKGVSARLTKGVSERLAEGVSARPAEGVSARPAEGVSARPAEGGPTTGASPAAGRALTLATPAQAPEAGRDAGRGRRRRGAGRRVDLVAVQAGGRREVLVVGPDGTERTEVRELPPRVDELRAALQRHLDEDPAVLEKLRDTSVFVLVAKRLDEAEQAHRTRRAQELTVSYSRKAMVGAMAAVAPGSDLIIQGYLGVALVKELSALYQVPVREMDTDLLLELARKRVARHTTIILAVAGNALKAFPGVGTLVGGLAQAVAYGMIFEALGKAVAQSLESRGVLRPAQAAQVFEESLSENLEARARRFARLALEVARADRPGLEKKPGS